MESLNFEGMDISVISEEALAELGEIFWKLAVPHCKEHRNITEKCDRSASALIDSLSDEQGEWFCDYQDMCAESLGIAIRRQFVCGFKVAMRLVLDGMT